MSRSYIYNNYNYLRTTLPTIFKLYINCYYLIAYIQHCDFRLRAIRVGVLRHDRIARNSSMTRGIKNKKYYKKKKVNDNNKNMLSKN